MQAGLTHESLTLVDSQTAVITIPQFAQYAIESPETIEVRLPPAVRQCCGGTIVATPSFVIQAPTPSALFGGTLLKNVGEQELRTSANYTLSIALAGDEWADGVGVPCAEGAACPTADVLVNLVATGSTASGWNNIVRNALEVDMATLLPESNSLLITLPAFPAFEIDGQETIVRGDASLLAPPSQGVCPPRIAR